MARKPTTEIKICFANATCALTDKDGTAYTLKRGDCWAADDPLPLFRPEFFDALPAFDAIRRSHLPDGFDIYGDPIPEWAV